ncbi:DUF3124 domain-containing protein [Cellulophaga baltica]|uniref:DUF3124 domain-containing protein n=1 Tax=Cellulophaga TaxID=104264 RepID=UPI001C06FF28|nr:MULTISPECIES: DUF3124 domain-containing protein [Cellulophaga]MBU2995805.1 DUF3124 domain-containing protein [Cellulophaga baltica]MDO6767200.1 DUF3124 domain-containing protein [Cellulophaga sp. 1_MG-2023]
MKNCILAFSILFFLFSCEEKKEEKTLNTVNWNNRILQNKLSDSLLEGSTYLSVYPQIYSLSEHSTHNLTATVSIRNTSITDSIYLTNATYYNTHGQLIRSYINKPVYLSPLETIAIVIEEKDKEGGTGANFIFDWKIETTTPEPFFEGIMISTSGQQGLSFTTKGERVK